jgi:hypothetical protein
VSPYLDVYSVTIANISRNSISIPINIGSSKQTVKTLIDSGAGGLFIDQNFTKNFDINYLDKPVKAYNVDRTENNKEQSMPMLTSSLPLVNKSSRNDFM